MERAMPDLKYFADEVDAAEATISTVAECTSLDAAAAALGAVAKRSPAKRFLLRQGPRIVRRSYSSRSPP
jgi:hypothetical protein